MYYKYENCPHQVKLQITKIITLCESLLRNNLAGIYLHGSLAMGCFNPERSDLDIIVVVFDAISPDARLQIIKKLLRISLCPSPVEISFLVQSKLQNENTPLSYDLHYSEYWRDSYKTRVIKPDDEIWKAQNLKDMDLPAHIRIINERGITLYGMNKSSSLPKVSDKNYIRAIMYDFEDAQDNYIIKPDYYILNSARVLAFLKEGKVLSKLEAGGWAEGHVPEEFIGIIRSSLNNYSGKKAIDIVPKHIVKIFLEYIQSEINNYLKLT